MDKIAWTGGLAPFAHPLSVFVFFSNATCPGGTWMHSEKWYPLLNKGRYQADSRESDDINILYVTKEAANVWLFLIGQ